MMSSVMSGMSVKIFQNYKKINSFALLRYHSCISSTINRYNFDKSRGTSIERNPLMYMLFLTTPNNLSLVEQRRYAKRKKTSKQQEEEEEESDEEDETYESLEPDEMGDNFNLITKSVPSMRVDSIIKAGLGITKKKVEKEFYASHIRVNSEKVLKKATVVYPEDEIDLIKGYSPENSRFLLVDRILVKSIGKVTGTGNYPVKMQVFKSLTIENYPEPWTKSSARVVEDEWK
ncbi:s4 RNA-binding domain-containing protein [Trichonephila clavata]|uniref:S4 RNA-binding domain-containing protein n=1 Tax=Trichonephila clavata TaxID=2740835 RepID=A0A8X6LYI0_TRICU|nr:s4 RNA-binding domain-containing protein [Trichonephila clavata]